MASTHQPENDSRPNMVFILTDQWRGDCLSVLGHPVVDTPNIDELAQRGAVFTAAYAACPTCIPARANIWTGQSPSRMGWLGFASGVPWKFETTLMLELRDAGYQTACVGKTHFSPPSARLGFEHLDSYEAGHATDKDYVNDYEEWLAEKTGNRIKQADHGLQYNSWLARPSHLPEELHNNTWVATKGIEFLARRDRTRPFFLNLSFHRPHPPFDPPQAFFDLYRDAPIADPPVGDWVEEAKPVKGVNAPFGRISERMLQRTRRAYYAQIAHIDMQIGRFVMELRRLGLYRNTWFVFTSDHGELLGDHHQFCKASALEGSAKIPLVIAPPPGQHRHSDMIRCDKPVSHYDLMPTLLEAAGVPVPASVDGKSLLPFCQGELNATWREYVHGEHTRIYRADNAMQFVTDGREKFIWNPITGRELFFDLQEDPQELHNLIGQPAARPRIDLWRRRLVEELRHRKQDRLTDGKNLIAGRDLPKVRAPEIR